MVVRVWMWGELRVTDNRVSFSGEGYVLELDSGDGFTTL